MTEDQERSVVTKVEQQKKNKYRYNIYINGNYTFSIHEDVMIKFRIFKDLEIDAAFIEEILYEDEKQRAYAESLRFIGRKPRSVFEVKEKLKTKGFEAGLIQGIIDKLISQNYLNDADFAKQWTESRIHYQRKGRRLINQELQMKGIRKEDIQEAVKEIEEETELEYAVQLARKKWNQTTGDTRDRMRKTMALLLRRGFPSGVVQQAIRKVSTQSAVDDLYIGDEDF